MKNLNQNSLSFKPDNSGLMRNQIKNVLNGSIDLAKIKNNHLVKQHLISSLIKEYLFIEHLTNQQVQNLKEFLIFCGRDFFTQYIFEVFLAKGIPQEKKFNASLNSSDF